MFKERKKRIRIGKWRCTICIPAPINFIISFVLFALSAYLMITAINSQNYYIGLISILLATLDFTLGDKTNDKCSRDNKE